MSNKQLLIIAFVWPEPSSTAAGNRMLQLLHFFLEQDYQITVASTAAESELSFDLESLGITKVSIQLNHSSFDTFIADLSPEIVVFDRFLTEEQFGWRVAEFAPQALRMLDTEDLHSLRHTREKAFKANILFTINLWLQNDMTKREIASIYRCDISLIISTFEMELLTDVLRMDESILMHLPFLLNTIDKKQTKDWLPFEDRQDFICIGNGKHAPNVDAIIWLKKEIWPLIRKELPEAQLHIYGSYLPEQIQQMHKPNDHFLIEGWAEDAHKTMSKARVNLAPLRFGAGIKGKLIDAMQTGTPSVTTLIGTEGMHGTLEWNGAIAENAADIAKAAIDLYTNKTTWHQAQQNGLQIINTLYSKVMYEQKLLSKITAIKDNIKTHRASNFIGAMLLHHSLASTKYMSKWIEGKNRGDR